MWVEIMCSIQCQNLTRISFKLAKYIKFIRSNLEIFYNPDFLLPLQPQEKTGQMTERAGDMLQAAKESVQEVLA